jgi:hypothetical protein
MPRVTVKTSTIFISVGEKTKVYRSVNDVPPPLRKKLEQSTNGINSATILIADRRGDRESDSGAAFRGSIAADFHDFADAGPSQAGSSGGQPRVLAQLGGDPLTWGDWRSSLSAI